MNLEVSGFFDDKNLNEKFYFSEKHLIGNGGTCELYKIKLDIRWYIRKNLLKEYNNHPTYQQSLKKEFEIGQHLDHPNIVRYLYRGKDELGDFLLLDYIDGITLREYITTTQLPKDFKSRLQAILPYIQQLCDAVEYLHQSGIYHGDIKPENILITKKSNTVKLIDFGHAFQDAYPAIKGGTINFIAPEILINPLLVSAASDVYAIGCILSLLCDNETLPSSFKSILDKCLEEDPSKRYNSIKELRNALNNYTTSNKKRIILFATLLAVIAIATVMLFHHNNVAPVIIEKKLDNITVDKKIDIPTIETKKENKISHINNNHKRIKLSLPLNRDSIFTVNEAGAFYDSISNKLKMNKDLTHGELFSLRNRYIVNANREWQNKYDSLKVANYQQYQYLHSIYNASYFNAYQKSNTLINQGK